MGGCRCTYRNCTVKSDGKTHMFHYPVFEKVRCHQWLLNAHRLDFLDLKVSQLKNRVVCQHHFKDENFMNFKKDKLTFDAIPTEDGPYCDAANYVDLNPDSSKLFSIIIEDIENDYNDKKANYSLKYGDFLANLDLMDIEKIDEDNISYKKTSKNNMGILATHGGSKGRLLNDDSSFLFNISLPNKNDNRSLRHPTLAVSPYMGNNDTRPNNVKSYLKSNSNDKNIFTEPKHNIVVTNAADNIICIQQKQEQQKKEPKVKIISEKKIINPVPITGKFELVKPDFVLNVSKRKIALENSQNNTSSSEDNKEITKEDKEKIIEIEIAPLIKEEEPKPTEDISLLHLSQNSFVSEKSPKVLVTKPKVPPERVKAINKKREFNMKLKDMVESCLDKLDNCNKPKEQNVPLKITKVTKRKVKRITSLPKNTSILSPQEYTIAFLEARMRKMENALLEKIEQNSMKIIDLKNTFVKTSSENQIGAQNKTDEETHKKQLFQEIGKYLSPSCKSLIYEELFINKFAITEPTTPPKHKRRRCK